MFHRDGPQKFVGTLEVSLGPSVESSLR